MTQILAIVGSALTIIIGLWRYFTSKSRVKKNRRNEAADMIKEGIKENDSSKITAGFGKLNRNR